jgi:hypothetical protein
VAELDEEMASLARLRADISEMLDDLPGSPSGGWRCGSELLQITNHPKETP